MGYMASNVGTDVKEGTEHITEGWVKKGSMGSRMRGSMCVFEDDDVESVCVCDAGNGKDA